MTKVFAQVAIAVFLVAELLTPNGAAAVGVGKTCGGIAGIKCDRKLWCDLQAGQCGGKDLQGKCVRVPEVCTKDFRPVCGCDKKTYGNNCERQAAKVHKAADGECK